MARPFLSGQKVERRMDAPAGLREVCPGRSSASDVQAPGHRQGRPANFRLSEPISSGATSVAAETQEPEC
jgi:hypothetical protein